MKYLEAGRNRREHFGADSGTEGNHNSDCLKEYIAEYSESQRFEKSTRVDNQTGLLVNEAGFITNYVPISVRVGDVISPLISRTEFCYAFYTREIRDELIYSYTYAPESNWAIFEPEYSDFQFSSQERIIKRSGYIRLVVQYSDRNDPQPGFNDLFYFNNKTENKHSVADWISKEADHIYERVNGLRTPDDALFLLLSDTHYAVGCNWTDTRASLRLAAERLRPDALIHLGDFTDGLMPGRHTAGIAAAIISELNTISGKVFICIGNHDKNRFRGNSDGINEKDCSVLYLGQRKSWYYKDLPERNLRLIFLDSFSPSEVERYGFSDREVCWLKRILCFTPEKYKIVVFSHVPPLPEIHVWSDTIRNGEKMLRILEQFNSKRGGAVLGWIHGHNHADQIWTKRAFPIVGIGCSKLESFQEHKPDGSITWQREKNSPAQELWDVLIVNVTERRMDFVRFGAGEDRRTVS